jgi:hypothetical protein
VPSALCPLSETPDPLFASSTLRSGLAFGATLCARSIAWLECLS